MVPRCTLEPRIHWTSAWSAVTLTAVEQTNGGFTFAPPGGRATLPWCTMDGVGGAGRCWSAATWPCRSCGGASLCGLDYGCRGQHLALLLAPMHSRVGVGIAWWGRRLVGHLYSVAVTANRLLFIQHLQLIRRGWFAASSASCVSWCR